MKRNSGLPPTSYAPTSTSNRPNTPFPSLANAVAKLYKAILPDLTATAFSGIVALFVVIAREILSLMPGSDISEIMSGVEQLMDISVATKDYIIREPGVSYDTHTLIDLNQIDFDALQAQFKTKHKHIEFEKLRGAVERKLKHMVQLNKSSSSIVACQTSFEEEGSSQHGGTPLVGVRLLLSI